MVIRHMQTADVAQVAGIIGKTPLWHRYGIDVAKATDIVSGALSDAELDPHHSFCIVAEDELGRVIGFAWVLLKGCFGRSGYLKLIGVREHMRGRGVGKRLLDAAEQKVLESGPDMFLLVSSFNEHAIRFYEAMGYERCGIIRDYVVRGIDEMLYRKRLGVVAPRSRQENDPM